MADEKEISVSTLEGAELSRPMDSKKPQEEKPRFPTTTHPITITGAQFMKVSETKADKKGNAYHPVSLLVTFTHPETKAPFTERYSGGYLYVQENGPERFWVGPKSQMGILKPKVEATYGLKDATMQQFLEALVGSKVGLATQDVPFGNTIYPKNMIVFILGK